MNRDLWIIIAAHNEERMLGDILRKLIDALPGVKIVVIDDGSTDLTGRVVLGTGVFYGRHELNLGQGAALGTGIQYAIQEGASAIVTFDADGQHDAADLLKLIEPVMRGEVDVVLGSRFINDQHAQRVPKVRKLILKLGARLTSLMTGLPLSDTHNGLRCFARTAAESLKINKHGMTHATEILFHISRSKLKFKEHPVNVHYSDYSREKGQKNLAAVWLFVDLMGSRLFPKLFRESKKCENAEEIQRRTLRAITRLS